MVVVNNSWEIAGWRNQPLNGCVKTVIERPYYAGLYGKVWIRGLPKSGEAVVHRSYNLQGQHIESRFYSHTGELLSVSVNEFSDKGEVVGKKTYDNEGGLVEQFRLSKYSRTFQGMEIACFDGYGNSCGFIKNKLGPGDLVRRTRVYDATGSLLSETVTDFDHQKNASRILTRMKSQHASTEVSIEYQQLDAKGNWTKRLEKCKAGMHTLWERTIIYFEQSIINRDRL